MSITRKSYLYLSPEAKVIALNVHRPILDVSPGSSPQNEQMDDNVDGYGENFWN